MDMSAAVEIDRPVEDVYAFVSEPANDGRWRAGIATSYMEGGGPITAGAIGWTRLDSEREGDEASVRWRVAEVHAPDYIAWKLLEGPFSGTGGYRLEASDSGTRFTLLADIEAQGTMRLLGPLFGWIGKRRNRADVATLKRVLESVG